jgi:hypothetical protein
MSAKKIKAQRSRYGYIGVLLVRGNDTSLYDKFVQEVNSNPELDQCKLVRLALTEYFARKDA